MNPVEESAKVTRNFQVTIPSRIRELLGIKEGDLVKFVLENDKLLLFPVKKRRLTYKAGFKISVEEIEKTVEESLDEATL
ncbi:MAG: AbrB/MazE/SpoVT family DNA-binding domain-containing protein [Thermoproteota archaeon]